MQKQEKGKAFIYILIITLFINLGIVLSISLISSYMINVMLISIMIIFDIYQLYYIIISIDTTYSINDTEIIIGSLFGLRKIYIPRNKIKNIRTIESKPELILLSGYEMLNFSFGRIYVEEIGMVRTYVSNFKTSLLIESDLGNFMINPENREQFLNMDNYFTEPVEEEIKNKTGNLIRDKFFAIPFVITIILIIAYVLIPYFRLTDSSVSILTIPLSFNASFEPLSWGTVDQFIFKQMTYGMITGVVLICMFIIAEFYSKYDHKSSYKYIYIPLIIIIALMYVQIKVLGIYV